MHGKQKIFLVGEHLETADYIPQATYKLARPVLWSAARKANKQQEQC